MTEIIGKLVFQAPGIGAVIVVVWMFIRHMDKRDEMLKELHDEHLEARQQSRDAIRDNAIATRENTLTISSLSEIMAKITWDKLP